MASAKKPNPHAVEVMRLVDAAVVLPKPEPAAIEKAIGIPLPKIKGPLKWEMHEGPFASGPFTKAELSYRPDLGSGMLILNARMEPQSLMELELDLNRFGPKPSPDLNPQTAPEGTAGYTFSFVDGAKKIEFIFTYQTRKLTTVALRWTPPGTKQTAGG